MPSLRKRRTFYRGKRRPADGWKCRLLGHSCYFSNHGDYFVCERCAAEIVGVPS